MAQPVVLPDTKLAVVTALQASTYLPSDITVAGAVQDDLAVIVATTGPYVAVQRPPGPPPALWMRTDTALLNVQVWAASEAAARDAAAAVHGVLHTLPGATSGGVTVTAVTDVQGLGELPDPGLPDLHRQAFTVQVRAHTA